MNELLLEEGVTARERDSCMHHRRRRKSDSEKWLLVASLSTFDVDRESVTQPFVTYAAAAAAGVEIESK